MAVDNPAGQRELRPPREARRHRVRGADELVFAGRRRFRRRTTSTPAWKAIVLHGPIKSPVIS
jgi:hypothetical protein